MRGISLILIRLWVIIIFIISLSPLRVDAAVSECQLCILEVRPVAESSTDNPSEDYILIYNRSLSSLTSIKLIYKNTLGVIVDTMSLSVGTIPVGGIKIFVGAGIAPLNTGATSLGAMNIAPSGGTLQLIKSTTIYDSVSWGTALPTELTPIILAEFGQGFSRIMSEGRVQDTNDNAADFQLTKDGCTGAVLSEVQPFAADASGEAIESWVELQGIQEPVSDCWLITEEGGRYMIPSGDLPAVGEFVVINRAIDESEQVTPLQLGGLDSQVWLANASVYSKPQFAYSSVISTRYPALKLGQTWSLIDGLWRATYDATPYEENNYNPKAPPPIIDETICDAVRITEVLPNPDGEDSGNEWIELHNTAAATVALESCQIAVGSTIYGFAAQDGLWPGEYRADTQLYSESGNVVNISLPNNSDSPLMISWQRLNIDKSITVIQSFYLYDGVLITAAEESQSLARFDGEWSWAVPTPDLDNNTIPSDVANKPTETFHSVIPSITTKTPGVVIELSELLPNPAAPLSDDYDEYVELYNPHDFSVNLAGYTIQVGNNFSYAFTFPDTMLAAKQYLTVTSGMSKLSFSNTSGQARLIEPAGSVVALTDAYAKAPEGQAWAKINGVWTWTAAPTPAARNSYIPPLEKKSTAVKKSTNLTGSSPSKDTKSSKSSTASKATEAVKGAATSFANSVQSAPLHPAVLAGVGGIALLYAGYEYRSDIANRIYQLRRNRADRRTRRSAAKGR